MGRQVKKEHANKASVSTLHERVAHLHLAIYDALVLALGRDVVYFSREAFRRQRRVQDVIQVNREQVQESFGARTSDLV